jgi:hypothetical protein
VLVLLVGAATAQVTTNGGSADQPQHTSANTAQHTSGLSNGSDLNVEMLPPHFTGDVPEVFFAQMDLPKKGEFESTKAYEERLAQRTNTPREAKFVIEPEEITYDADRELFVVRLTEKDYYVGNTRWTRISWKLRTLPFQLERTMLLTLSAQQQPLTIAILFHITSRGGRAVKD